MTASFGGIWDCRSCKCSDEFGRTRGAEKLVNVVLSGLGWELKFIRNGRGLSLEVVCQQLRWQQSKLSRML